jgi:hypothetical protein
MGWFTSKALIAFDRSEKRGEPRVPCAAVVELAGRGGSSSKLPHLAVYLEDISPTGVGITADRPLRNLTPVVLRYPDGELPGVVRHSRYLQADKYFIGIEFSFGCRWSPEYFEPDWLKDAGQG